MIPYIRGNFWAARDFSSLDEINQQLLQWCLTGQRTHGTTRQRPMEVFQAIEQAALQPLPSEPFEIVTWAKAKVGRDCYFYAGGKGDENHVKWQLSVPRGWSIWMKSKWVNNVKSDIFPLH